MEKLVTIVSVGVYAERQYQKQDGSQEYLASRNRDTQFAQGQPYIVKGFWKHRTWGENNDRHENIFIITDIQNL